MMSTSDCRMIATGPLPFQSRTGEGPGVRVKIYSVYHDPAHVHSFTDIRLGGRALLTIQYHNYEITSAAPIGNMPPHGNSSGPYH
jgi:hypothetical protein